VQREAIRNVLAAYIVDLEKDLRAGVFLNSDHSTFFQAVCTDHLWARAYLRNRLGAPHVLKFAEALDACEEFDQRPKDGEKFDEAVKRVAKDYGPKPRTMAGLISMRRFCRELQERAQATLGIGPLFWDHERIQKPFSLNHSSRSNPRLESRYSSSPRESRRRSNRPHR